MEQLNFQMEQLNFIHDERIMLKNQTIERHRRLRGATVFVALLVPFSSLSALRSAPLYRTPCPFYHRYASCKAAVSRLLSPISHA